MYWGTEGISAQGRGTRSAKQRFWVTDRSQGRLSRTQPFPSLNGPDVQSQEACDDKVDAHLNRGSNSPCLYLTPLPRSTLRFDHGGQTQTAQEGDIIHSSLNAAIDGLNLAKEFSSITPATPIFGAVAVFLTMLRVNFHLFRDEMFHAHT